MSVYRLSPSKIEQFRKHYNSELNGIITKESVIDSILGVKTWKAQLDFGTAYHAIIENGFAKYYNESTSMLHVKEDDMKETEIFTMDEAAPAIKYHNSILGAVHECWWEHRFDYGKYSIVVPMRIDVMHGQRCHEIKTTSRPVDVESYMNSSQWKIYLVATGTSYVQYDIFRYWAKKEGENRRIEPVSFKCYPEHDIEQNMKSLARLALEFCFDNGIGENVRYVKK